ncbi:SGNH/GDSL hydrolase family protein [Arthrobacter psychrochitiniphilus]|uniref:SGNH/GDSL hydrolase family protein n=1 Tax=Arthrobacter psychrochitiniphilus TaxID=291045 RepID=UPI003F7C5992
MGSSTIVFAGDSITDCNHLTEEFSPFGGGYVSFLAEELLVRDEKTVIVNSGISGNRSQDLAKRWDQDVLEHGPDIVSILIGVNDTWRRFDGGEPTTAEAFESNCRSMLERTLPSGDTQVVMVEPFLLPVTKEQATWLEDLEAKVSVVRALSAEFGTALLKAHEFLTEAATIHSPEVLTADGVHPTTYGHRILAEKWLELMSGPAV